MFSTTEKVIFFIILAGLAVLIWARIYSNAKNGKSPCGCQKKKTATTTASSPLTSLQPVSVQTGATSSALSNLV